MSTIDQLPTDSKGNPIFDRLHDGTDEIIEENGLAASIRFYGPWTQRLAFYKIAAGQPEQVTMPGGIVVTRIVPLKYPVPWWPRTYACRIRCRGDGQSRVGEGGIEYDWAFIDVDFKTYPFDFDGSAPLITEQMAGGADFITRPGSAYKFPSDNTVVQQDVGVLVPTNDFSLTFHMVPSLNKSLYTSLQGRVNTVAFYGYDVGTVQYLGPSTQVTLNIANQYSYEVTHRFKWRWIPHNQIMRPDGSGFEAPVQVGAAANYILPTADLNQLFQ